MYVFLNIINQISSEMSSSCKILIIDLLPERGPSLWLFAKDSSLLENFFVRNKLSLFFALIDLLSLSNKDGHPF